MVRGKISGLQRAGAAVLQPELRGFSTVHPAGYAAGKTADQCGQCGGMEGKADAGGAGQQGRETRETGAAGVRGNEYEHRAGRADRHRAVSPEAGSL